MQGERCLWNALLALLSLNLKPASFLPLNKAVEHCCISASVCVAPGVTVGWGNGGSITHTCVLCFLPRRPCADAAASRVPPARTARERPHRVRPLQRWGGPLHRGRVRLAAVCSGLEPEKSAVFPHGQEASRVH